MMMDKHDKLAMRTLKLELFSSIAGTLLYLTLAFWISFWAYSHRIWEKREPPPPAEPIDIIIQQPCAETSEPPPPQKKRSWDRQADMVAGV
jgi:hypothetical protein